MTLRPAMQRLVTHHPTTQRRAIRRQAAAEVKRGGAVRSVRAIRCPTLTPMAAEARRDRVATASERLAATGRGRAGLGRAARQPDRRKADSPVRRSAAGLGQTVGGSLVRRSGAGLGQTVGGSLVRRSGAGLGQTVGGLLVRRSGAGRGQTVGGSRGRGVSQAGRLAVVSLIDPMLADSRGPPGGFGGPAASDFGGWPDGSGGAAGRGFPGGPAASSGWASDGGSGFSEPGGWGSAGPAVADYPPPGFAETGEQGFSIDWRQDTDDRPGDVRRAGPGIAPPRPADGGRPGWSGLATDTGGLERVGSTDPGWVAGPQAAEAGRRAGAPGAPAPEDRRVAGPAPKKPKAGKPAKPSRKERKQATAKDRGRAAVADQPTAGVAGPGAAAPVQPGAGSAGRAGSAAAPAVKKGKAAPAVKKGKAAPAVNKGKAAPAVKKGKAAPAVKKGKAAPAVKKGKAAPTSKAGSGPGAAASPAQAGRTGGKAKPGRRKRRRAYLLAGGAGVVVVAAVGFELLPSGGGGPAHVISTPQRLGNWVQAPALASSMNATELRKSIVAQSGGDASHVAAVVYQANSGANTAAGPQIVLFIGGNRSGSSPGAFIASFIGSQPGAVTTSPGPLGGAAGCVPSAAGGLAECAWADNDTFGLVTSPTLSTDALAGVLRQLRPEVEHRAR